MFTSTSIAQDFSIFFRCQYRIANRRRPKSGPRSRLPGTTLRRHIAVDHPLLQNESQSGTVEQAQKNVLPPAQKSRDVKLHPRIWKYGNENMPSLVNLGVNALGEPAKIIMLPEAEEKYSFRPDNVEDALENQHINISPAEILENIQEEPALVDFEEVSIHIESLRTSWLSQSQNQTSTLPKAKYLQLLTSLHEGFTRDQLVGYYEAGIAKLQESVYELAHPHSSKLYARLSWVPGCSPFPGKAADQLRSLKNRHLRNQKNDVDANEIISEESGTFKQPLGQKSVIAELIIQVLWNAKVPEEVGELNMWIDPIYFSILLSDRKSMFNRTTESYGAKVDVSRSRNIIRITSSKETCCDVFNFIVRTLENIQDVQFYLPPVPQKNLLPAYTRRILESSLIKKIEHDTGTVIQRVPHSIPKSRGKLRKYRIFYLGPDEDELVSAKEELIEASRFITGKPQPVVWESEECLQGRPRPVEVGSAMSLVARETKWSRWASPIRRNSGVALKGKRSGLSQGCSYALLRSILNILFQATVPSLSNHPERYESLSWKETLKRRTFATLGQILYPSERLKALSQTIQTKNVSLRSTTLRNGLYTQRHLFCGFPGLRLMLQDANPGPQVCEDLRIRLRPSPESLAEEGDRRVFPDVELRIKCDLATKSCVFSSARLILDGKEVDLLLPTEMVDIRFCTTSHILSGAKTDIEILKYLSSSKFDVFADQALTFPNTVSLSIPPHLVRKPPGKTASTKKAAATKEAAPKSKSPQGSSSLEGTADIDVKYSLSTLEHWSYMSGNIEGLNFRYAIITSGTTRTREEIRVELHEQEVGSAPDVEAFMAQFPVLWGMIAKLRDVNQASGNYDNLVASLDPETPSGEFDLADTNMA